MGIWLYDWQREKMARLTISTHLDQYPTWSPDGKYIAFESEKNSNAGNLHWIRADGGGGAIRLTASKNQQYPYSFSPDGKRLAFVEQNPETGWDIWTLPLDLTDPDHPKPGAPEVFLRSPAVELYPVFSPDGRWIAYMSSEAGGPEVYVRPYPGPGGKWQISASGGTMPVWSRKSAELYFRSPDGRIMAVPYTTKDVVFAADNPRPWSDWRLAETGVFASFDPAPDGKRFAVLQTRESDGDQRGMTHAIFLLNFFDELRRKAK
jgi:serine/threonine-protein kinase